MSWLFSQALVAAYSEEQSLDGEPSAPLNVTPTVHPFWHRDKMMEPSQLSRYGLMCRVLTADHGAELLTSYLADFRARTSAQPEREQASPEPAADYGDTWHGSLARYDPAMRLWKTAQPSLFEGSELSLVTFPRSGMTADGLLWELPTSAPRTSEIGSGLWQTPVADDAVERERGKWNSRGEPKLSAQVKLIPTPIAGDAKSNRNSTANRKRIPPTGIHAGDTLTDYATKWPTPKSSDYRGGLATRAGGRRSNLNDSAKKFPTPTVIDAGSGRVNRSASDGATERPTLARMAKTGLLATPTARDWRSGKASEATHKKNSRPLSEQIGGSLNPEWVEWLMNWPLGWTDLEPSAMDKYRNVWPRPGED